MNAITRPTTLALELTASREDRYALLTEAMGRYVDGDARAFNTVYRLLYPMVLACQRRWAGVDRAEDLAQQTFLKVHRNRHRYRTGSPVGPWVLAIARHLSIDALRKAGRSRETLTREGTLPDRLTDHRDPAIDAEIKEAVRAAVETLPPSQRAVIAMHKLDERSFAEVAEALDINEGAARVRAHRAYARLRKALHGFSPAMAA